MERKSDLKRANDEWMNEWVKQREERSSVTAWKRERERLTKEDQNKTQQVWLLNPEETCSQRAAGGTFTLKRASDSPLTAGYSWELLFWNKITEGLDRELLRDFYLETRSERSRWGLSQWCWWINPSSLCWTCPLTESTSTVNTRPGQEVKNSCFLSTFHSKCLKCLITLVWLVENPSRQLRWVFHLFAFLSVK